MQEKTIFLILNVLKWKAFTMKVDHFEIVDIVEQFTLLKLQIIFEFKLFLEAPRLGEREIVTLKWEPFHDENICMFGLGYNFQKIV